MQLPSLPPPPTYMHPCPPAQFPVSNNVLPLSPHSTLPYYVLYVDSPSPLLLTDITTSIAARVGREHETPVLLVFASIRMHTHFLPRDCIMDSPAKPLPGATDHKLDHATGHTLLVSSTRTK